MSTPSGIGLKLSYRTLSTKGFYFSFFQLPYDTNHCPVDVFINLDTSRNMNGFSYYSNCLELLYDSLVLGKLENRFYIPMSTDTLCVDPQSFTDYFSSPSTYGLFIQSSLFPDLSYYQLNPILKLYPGTNNVAVTMAISSIMEEKFATLHSVEVTVLDGSLVTSITLHNNEVSFKGYTVIFNNELYYAHLLGMTSTDKSWEDMVLSLEGWFPKETGRFSTLIEKTVHRYLEQISRKVAMRIETADDQFASASEAFSTAQEQVESAETAYEGAVRSLKDLLLKLEEAELLFNQTQEILNNATGDLQMAEKALDFCTLETCSKVCVPTARPTIERQRNYRTETFTCPRICTKVVNNTVPYYVLTYAWAFFSGCRIYFTPCYYNYYHSYLGVCQRFLCLSRCQRYSYLKRFLRRVSNIVHYPCNKSCTARYFVGFVEKTVIVNDPCGKMVPEAACAERNDRCSKERQTALNLIEQKRKGLTAPLQNNNVARRFLAMARNEVTKQELLVESMEDNLEIAKAAHRRSKQRRNSTMMMHQTIKNSDQTGYKVYRLTQRYSIESLFNLSSVSFSVTHSPSSTPFIFPITISYMSAGNQHYLTTTYHFKTAFQSQESLLTSTIVENLLGGISVRRRQAEVNEIDDDFGENQFQIRCVYLESLNTFMSTLYDTLQLSNDDKIESDRTLNASLLAIKQLNSTLNSSNLSFNYTTLQNSFNISVEEIENIEPQVEEETENELDLVLEIIESLYELVGNYAHERETEIIIQWQSKMDFSFQEGLTLASSKCFGLKDCILVLGTEIESMLNFAPELYTNDIEALLPNATETLLLLSANNSISLSNFFKYLLPMQNIIESMNKSGYWCAQPPSFNELPLTDTNVSVGGLLTLNCHASSLLPLSYHWKKEGVAIRGATNNTLNIYNMQVFDEGNYSCEATNAVKTVKSTNSSVHTFELPQFYLTPVSIVTYIGNVNGALFTCNATARPDPGWLWLYKKTVDEDWTEIQGEDTNELYISQPVKKNEGWYKCVAFNYHGNLSSEAVFLRLVKATTRVNSFPVRFLIESAVGEEPGIVKREALSINNAILNYLQEKLSVNTSLVSNLMVSTTNNGTMYKVSFLLVAQNTTDKNTGMNSLSAIAESLAIARTDLLMNRDSIESDFKRNQTIVTYGGTQYMPVLSSFTVQNEQILCPAGQQLHSNSFVCSKIYLH